TRARAAAAEGGPSSAGRPRRAGSSSGLLRDAVVARADAREVEVEAVADAERLRRALGTAALPALGAELEAESASPLRVPQARRVRGRALAEHEGAETLAARALPGERAAGAEEKTRPGGGDADPFQRLPPRHSRGQRPREIVESFFHARLTSFSAVSSR